MSDALGFHNFVPRWALLMHGRALSKGRERSKFGRTRREQAALPPLSPGIQLLQGKEGGETAVLEGREGASWSGGSSAEQRRPAHPWSVAGMSLALKSNWV